jgi:hypothetical protein
MNIEFFRRVKLKDSVLFTFMSQLFLYRIHVHVTYWLVHIVCVICEYLYHQYVL